MYKILLVIIFTPSIIYSQKLDSLNNINKTDSIIHYQYRVSLDNITTIDGSKIVSPQLFDVFHVIPKFCEHINQYVIESDVDVEKNQLETILFNSDYKVKYFKKVKLLAYEH
jgi:hypothetical protein